MHLVDMSLLHYEFEKCNVKLNYPIILQAISCWFFFFFEFQIQLPLESVEGPKETTCPFKHGHRLKEHFETPRVAAGRAAVLNESDRKTAGSGVAAMPVSMSRWGLLPLPLTAILRSSFLSGVKTPML